MPTELENSDVKVITSEKFSLNWRDWTRGALMAVGSAVTTSIIESISGDSVLLNWKHISIVGLGTLLMYISKNFFSPSQTIVRFKPPVETTSGVTVTPAPKDVIK